jgi:hypothetical protein
MPPLIIWALGALGAVVLVRLVAREARRINAELHPHRPATVEGNDADAVHLERDPKTGVYRPR